MEEKINKRVGQYFYGYEDTSLMRELLKRFEEKINNSRGRKFDWRIFSIRNDSVVGVSTMLIGGIVCYSNQAKLSLSM